jgi:hypothetical protein
LEGFMHANVACMVSSVLKGFIFQLSTRLYKKH